MPSKNQNLSEQKRIALQKKGEQEFFLNWIDALSDERFFIKQLSIKNSLISIR